jgi:hypothetical protein
MNVTLLLTMVTSDVDQLAGAIGGDVVREDVVGGRDGTRCSRSEASSDVGARARCGMVKTARRGHLKNRKRSVVC